MVACSLPGYVEEHVRLALVGDVVPPRPAGARQPGAAGGARGGAGHRLFVLDPAIWARRRSGPAGLAGGQRARPRRAHPADHPLRRPARRRAARGRRPPRSTSSAETTPYGRRRDDAPSAERVELRRDRFAVRRRAGTGRATAAAAPTRCSPPSPAPGASTAGRSPPPPPLPRPRAGRLRPAGDWTCWRQAVADAPFDLPAAGEDAAWRRWHAFRDERHGRLPDERDRPDHDGTSRLSPYLHLGVLHPRSLLGGGRRRARRTPTSWPGASSTPTCCGTRPASAWADLKPALAGMAYDEPGGRDRGVAHRHHRLPDRRRRDAPAAAHRVDAQPGPDDHRLLPDQGPARVVAGRGAALPRPARSTATWPPTTTAGSGWPAPAPTPRPTSGSSTPSPRG